MDKDKLDVPWQHQLLPMMSRTIIFVAIFFFAASLVQLLYLNYKISNPSTSGNTELAFLLQLQPEDPHVALEISERASFVLEHAAMKQRYHQANVLLMSRVWTRYLGFVTGMTMSIVGAVFILGKIETSQSKIEATISDYKYLIASNSPGVLLAGFGTMLMLATILIHRDIVVVDKPIYVQTTHHVENSAQRPNFSQSDIVTE